MSEPEVVEAIRRAVEAAQQAARVADADPTSSKAVRTAVQFALEAAQTVLHVAESTPRRRQSLEEFVHLFGEEIKENGTRYAERTLRQAKSLVEDHFHIDEAFRLLGPLTQDSNLARDLHDLFNLVALVPVVLLNLWNWTCSDIGTACGVLAGRSVTEMWTGEAFGVFWWTTTLYFILDIMWMLLLPQCVKSPKVILQHHLATLGYIIIPYLRPRYGWLMGACMLVEVNTWFIIARRYFNKRGLKPCAPGVPVATSLRLLTVSFCFYVTWFVIRLGFYPYLLVVIVNEWFKYSIEVGTPLNLIAVCPVMQLVFIFLNLKWTVDLIRSKLKGFGPAKGL